MLKKLIKKRFLSKWFTSRTCDKFFTSEINIKISRLIISELTNSSVALNSILIKWLSTKSSALMLKNKNGTAKIMKNSAYEYELVKFFIVLAQNRTKLMTFISFQLIQDDKPNKAIRKKIHDKQVTKSNQNSGLLFSFLCLVATVTILIIFFG